MGISDGRDGRWDGRQDREMRWYGNRYEAGWGMILEWEVR